MTALRTIKKLLFGETWLLPLGVAATFAAGQAIHLAAPYVWARAGGPLMLCATLGVLVAAVAVAARRRDRGARRARQPDLGSIAAPDRSGCQSDEVSLTGDQVDKPPPSAAAST